MSVNGKVLYFGQFTTPREAALCYDMHARRIHGDLATLNFPAITDYSGLRRRRLPPKTSRYPGVSWQPKSGNWRARISRDGKTYELGLFKREADAARAYREAMKRI